MHRQPARRSLTALGPDFSRLWAASAISNLGDGVTRAAAPLLIVALTRDPAAVAGATVAQQLPWLLFPLIAGVYVDRLDRRRLAVAVNMCRGTVMAALALAVWADAATLAAVYVTIFVLAAAETLSDGASIALVPSLVPPERLARANGRLAGAQIVGDQLAGPSLGAALFAATAGLPFTLDAITFFAAATLLAATTPLPRRPAETRSQPVRREVRIGLQWLWHSPTLRLLAVLLALMNVTFMAAFATWVLFVRQRLGLGAVGFGALLSVGALGGLVGSAAVARLTDRLGSAKVLRTGLLVETTTHLVLATTRNPWAAAVTMFVFGIHASAWGVTALTVRQRLVPYRLLGRVNSAYALLDKGGAALGAVLGGVLASRLGLTGPFWFAFLSMALLTAIVLVRRPSPSV